VSKKQQQQQQQQQPGQNKNKSETFSMLVFGRCLCVVMAEPKNKEKFPLLICALCHFEHLPQNNNNNNNNKPANNPANNLANNQLESQSKENFFFVWLLARLFVGWSLFWQLLLLLRTRKQKMSCFAFVRLECFSNLSTCHNAKPETFLCLVFVVTTEPKKKKKSFPTANLCFLGGFMFICVICVTTTCPFHPRPSVKKKFSLLVECRELALSWHLPDEKKKKKSFPTKFGRLAISRIAKNNSHQHQNPKGFHRWGVSIMTKSKKKFPTEHSCILSFCLNAATSKVKPFLCLGFGQIGLLVSRGQTIGS